MIQPKTEARPGRRLDAAPRTPIRYLSRECVEGLLASMDDVSEIVRAALHDKGTGLAESPPKRGVTPRPGASIRAMKAHLPQLDAAGVKWISAFPDNMDAGLPTISGLVILNDLETGFPTAVMDCAAITAHRTAACTAITARHLARRGSSTVGLVACGLQGRMNLQALCRELDITRVRAYDIRFEAACRFADEMEEKLGVEIEPVETPADAARDCDILVTSCPIEKHPTPPLGTGLLKKGALACLLDFDAALTGDAIREADRFVADDVRQVAFFKEIGYLEHTPEPDCDLGKIVAGRVPGRVDPDETIVAMNLGIGVLDIAVAAHILESALDLGVGVDLPR